MNNPLMYIDLFGKKAKEVNPNDNIASEEYLNFLQRTRDYTAYAWYGATWVVVIAAAVWAPVVIPATLAFGLSVWVVWVAAWFLQSVQTRAWNPFLTEAAGFWVWFFWWDVLLQPLLKKA
jgi:hypothetical protein